MPLQVTTTHHLRQLRLFLSLNSQPQVEPPWLNLNTLPSISKSKTQGRRPQALSLWSPIQGQDSLLSPFLFLSSSLYLFFVWSEISSIGLVISGFEDWKRDFLFFYFFLFGCCCGDLKRRDFWDWLFGRVFDVEFVACFKKASLRISKKKKKASFLVGLNGARWGQVRAPGKKSV